MAAVVRQIMNDRVVAIHPHDSVVETIDVLTRENTGCLPVVDADGGLLGMVTEQALIDVVFDNAAKDDVAANYLVRDVPCVHPDDPLSRVAKLFALYAAQRLFVVYDARLVGTVTCRDLMNYALRNKVVLNEPLLELIPSFAPLS
jgi:CBS domain-containing protein